MYSKEEVEQANIELSKHLADKYNETEPHYKEENKDIVKAKLKELQERTNGSSLLDMGCGTGFIIDLAKEYFYIVYGCDISRDMLNKVNKSSKDKDRVIETWECSTAETNFKSNLVDVVTAYSLLHHLHDIKPTLKEAYRVLKPGGIFWSALDPNFHFFSALKDLPEYNNTDNEYSSIVTRELEEIYKKKADPLFRNAEPLKYYGNGLLPEEVEETLYNIGFSQVKVELYWLLGEGSLIHKEAWSPWELGKVKSYIQDLLPLSRHLFKYISITAVK